MSGRIKDIHAARHLLSATTPKSRLLGSHRHILPRSAFRFASHQSSPHPPRSPPSTVSDRLVVAGLLTLTGLVGVGFGMGPKSQKTSVAQEQAAIPESSQKPDEETSSEPLEEPTPSNESPEQGAFNPETGEINWDCPCLGGMAHGVCGEQFKAAFSCFVYSEQDPKGVECIEKFKDMQDCFREHPDEYGPELVDSDESALDGEPTPSTEPTEGLDRAGQPEQLSSTPNDTITEPVSAIDRQQSSSSVNANESPQRTSQPKSIQTHRSVSQLPAVSTQPKNQPQVGKTTIPKTITPESETAV